MNKRFKLATVNKALKAAGYAEQLVQGNGYWYFVDGDAAKWFSSSVAVYRLNELSIERWIDERNRLANDYRNR